MKRFQLPEFEDQTWLPTTLRNLMTELLQYHITDLFKVYDPVIPMIDQLLKDTGETQVVDLCSGSSGPWPHIINCLSELVTVTLTDKYPNLEAWRRIAQASGKRIGFCNDSVDVLAVPEHLKGLRTFFTSLHHFQPETVTQILRDAVLTSQPIAVFEFTGRSLQNLMGAMWIPALAFFTSPFVRPLTLTRYFWTYIIPAVPFLYWWDGTISNLRSYTAEDLKRMVSDIDSNGYKWEIGTKTSKESPCTITYLIGYK